MAISHSIWTQTTTASKCSTARLIISGCCFSQIIKMRRWTSTAKTTMIRCYVKKTIQQKVLSLRKFLWLLMNKNIKINHNPPPPPQIIASHSWTHKFPEKCFPSPLFITAGKLPCWRLLPNQVGFLSPSHVPTTTRSI